MAEKVFKYKVVTQVDTSPLKALEKALQSINSSFNMIEKGFTKTFSLMKGGIKGVTDSISKLTNSLKGLGSVGGTSMQNLFASVGKLAAGFAAVQLAVGALKGTFGFFTGILDKISFKESTVKSLDLFFKGRGKDMFASYIDLANKTTADTEPLVARSKMLAGTGFSERQIYKTLAGSADLEAFAGGGEKGKEIGDQYAVAMKILSGGGRLEVGTDLIQKVIGTVNLTRQTAKAAGIKNWESGPIMELRKKIDAMRNSGKLTPKIAATGLEQAALTTTKSSALGDYTREMSKGTMMGALSNFKNAWDNLLLSQDFDKIPGIKGFINFLSKLSDFLSGKGMSKNMANIIEAIFKPFQKFEGENSEQTLKKFFDWLEEKALKIADYFRKVYDYINGLLEKETGADALLQVVEDLSSVFVKIGSYIGEGVKNAIFNIDFSEIRKKMIDAITPGGGHFGEQLREKLWAKVFGKKEDQTGPKRAGNVWIDESDLSPEIMNPPNYTPSQSTSTIEVNQTFNGPTDPEKVKQATTDGVNKANQQKTQRMAGASR